MGVKTRYKMLIDGQWVDAADGRVFDSVNPATGEAWAEIPGASTVILEGLRHLAMIEDPARFNTALLSFLNAVRDGRAS